MTGGEAKGSLAIGEPPCSRKPRPRLGPYPPSRLSTHLCEAAALFLVLILLGMFWGGLDSFSSWYLSDIMAGGGEDDAQNVTTNNDTLSVDEVSDGWSLPPMPLTPLLILVGVIMTAGALPAIPILWHVEKIIEICGHANLLIIAFTLYIVRYAVFSFVDDGWWVLISEAVGAPVSVGLAWATAVHYTHLLFPPRFSGTAQAAAIVAHFCIGRCLGSVIGAFVWAESGLKVFLQGGALVSALVASVYFLIYHFCLKARCIGGTSSSSRPVGANAKGPAWAGQGRDPGQEGPTTNGNYTPLRVYHNGRGEDRKSRY